MDEPHIPAETDPRASVFGCLAAIMAFAWVLTVGGLVTVVAAAAVAAPAGPMTGESYNRFFVLHDAFWLSLLAAAAIAVCTRAWIKSRIADAHGPGRRLTDS